MRFDRLTEKAREAIIEAQSEAQEYRHASILLTRRRPSRLTHFKTSVIID